MSAARSPTSGELLQMMLTMVTPESVHTARIAAFCDAFEATLAAPPAAHTPRSHVEALATAQRILDWTLPADVTAPVTAHTCAAITRLCAAIAAHAWAISEEIAARPRAEPMKPVPSAADALLHPSPQERPTMQTDTHAAPGMSPEASASLDRARAMLINRVRILDPDRIADDSLTVIVAGQGNEGRVRLIDETSGAVLQFDAERAEEIGRALLAGAVKLRADARDAAARQQRDDARFLTA